MLGRGLRGAESCDTLEEGALGLVLSCCTLSVYFSPVGGEGPGSVLLLRPPEGCCASEAVLPQVVARPERSGVILLEEERE